MALKRIFFILQLKFSIFRGFCPDEAASECEFISAMKNDLIRTEEIAVKTGVGSCKPEETGGKGIDFSPDGDEGWVKNSSSKR